MLVLHRRVETAPNSGHSRQYGSTNMRQFLRRFWFPETFFALCFTGVYAWVYGGRAINLAPTLRPTTGLGRFSAYPEAATLEFCLALCVLLVLALAPKRPSWLVVSGSVATALAVFVLMLEYSFMVDTALLFAAGQLAARYSRAQ